MYSCSSTPLKPGICTSTIRQEVPPNRGNAKNCAEANSYIANATDLNNRAVAVRAEASSSTIEMIRTVHATERLQGVGRLERGCTRGVVIARTFAPLAWGLREATPISAAAATNL